MALDFTDFYIEYPGHPRFRDLQIIEDDVVRIILQKWEMILFTNKGELFLNLILEEIWKNFYMKLDYQLKQ